MTALAAGSEDELCRPCVDCGLFTGRFCDGNEFEASGTPCFAEDRIPSENWVDNQRTPFCSRCENRHGKRHYCRGVQTCMPFPLRNDDNGPQQGNTIDAGNAEIPPGVGIGGCAYAVTAKDMERTERGWNEQQQPPASICGCGSDRAACGQCGRGWTQQRHPGDGKMMYGPIHH